jgi:arsenite/tail-anchored protein-transporting ATPase
VAVKCADSGLSTLVISTDPAHSLGDALDQAVGGGQPVRVAGIDNLWAMEVDATEAIKVSLVCFTYLCT